MQSTYSVIAILKKEQRLKRQKGLIMLRITVDGKRAEISIKRKLDPARWDSSTNRVKGNKEEAREINSLIDSMILKVNRIHNTLLERDITITASEIKNVFLGRNANHRKLLEIFTLHNEMMASRVGMDFSKSTSTRYNTTYDHVAQFVKERYNLEDMCLNDIQFSFITDLEHFLKVTKKFNHFSSYQKHQKADIEYL